MEARMAGNSMSVAVGFCLHMTVALCCLRGIPHCQVFPAARVGYIALREMDHTAVEEVVRVGIGTAAVNQYRNRSREYC
jgi:hypothetical protein